MPLHAAEEAAPDVQDLDAAFKNVLDCDQYDELEMLRKTADKNLKEEVAN